MITREQAEQMIGKEFKHKAKNLRRTVTRIDYEEDLNEWVVVYQPEEKCCTLKNFVSWAGADAMPWRHS